MIDVSTLTHDDLPPPPAPSAAPAPLAGFGSGGWRSSREEAQAARGRLFWARVRAVHDPVDEDGRAGCRGEALLADLRRAAPASGWRALPEGDDDLALLQLAGALPMRGPAYVAALGRDPASGEPLVMWLAEGRPVPRAAWPHEAARRIAEQQDAALPGRVRDRWPAPAPGPLATELILAGADLLRAEVAARAEAAARRAASRSAPPVPAHHQYGGAPLPDDDEVPF